MFCCVLSFVFLYLVKLGILWRGYFLKLSFRSYGFILFLLDFWVVVLLKVFFLSCIELENILKLSLIVWDILILKFWVNLYWVKLMYIWRWCEFLGLFIIVFRSIDLSVILGEKWKKEVERKIEWDKRVKEIRDFVIFIIIISLLYFVVCVLG